MTTKQIDIQSIIRARIGRRWRITREQAAEIIDDIIEAGIDPRNVCVAASDSPSRQWADMIRGITCVSVLATVDGDPGLAGRYHGSIRFDEPGSMHPMFRADLMFAHHTLAEYDHDQLGQMRRKAQRLLVVID